MKRQTGFTLIEIMLVVVIIAMGATMIVMTLPNNKNDVIEKAALQFYQKLQLLNEDAVLGGKDYGIRIDDKKSKYTFLTLNWEGWAEMTDHRYFHQQELDQKVHLKLDIGSSVWEQKTDSFFDSDTLFEDDKFADIGNDKQVSPPQIWVSSSGEMTPFELIFYIQGNDPDQKGWRLKANESGELHLFAPGEDKQDDKMARNDLN